MLGGHPSHGVLAVGRHIRAQRRAAIGLGGGELRRGLRSVSMSDLYALSAHHCEIRPVPTKFRDFMGERGK